MNPSALPTTAALARRAMARSAMRLRRPPFWLLLALLGAGLALFELRTSRLQAMLFSDFAKQISFRLEAGKSPTVRFPTTGPHDERLGYTELPRFISQLEHAGYEVKFQARPSPRMRELMDWGLPAIYHEKVRTGLSIEDHTGRSLSHARYPARIYRNFASIPPLVLETLLFIENRELLEPGARTRNPVIEWDRLAAATLSQLRPRAQGQSLPGGSTLATQIEKYLHSPGGYTAGSFDKLRQIGAATLRAYLDGPDTTATRKRIALDYLNTVPLAARAGFGELRGLGDGLWAWHGADFAEVNALLSEPESLSNLARRARAYRQVLSLILAQRRPSGLLISDRAALRELTDRHLVLLEQAGVIDARLRDAALVDRPRVPARRSAQPAGLVRRDQGRRRGARRAALAAARRRDLPARSPGCAGHHHARHAHPDRRAARAPGRARSERPGRHAARAAAARQRRPGEGRLLLFALRADGRRPTCCARRSTRWSSRST